MEVYYTDTLKIIVDEGVIAYITRSKDINYFLVTIEDGEQVECNKMNELDTLEMFSGFLTSHNLNAINKKFKYES